MLTSDRRSTPLPHLVRYLRAAKVHAEHSRRAGPRPDGRARGDRWSVAGRHDLLTIQLARMTNHPAWATLQSITHPPNAIHYSLEPAKFNAG